MAGSRKKMRYETDANTQAYGYDQYYYVDIDESNSEVSTFDDVTEANNVGLKPLPKNAIKMRYAVVRSADGIVRKLYQGKPTAGIFDPVIASRIISLFLPDFFTGLVKLFSVVRIVGEVCRAETPLAADTGLVDGDAT